MGGLRSSRPASNLTSMPTAIHRRVETLRSVGSSALIARMKSGWAVMADRQVTRGQCLLLPDPVVASLNELKGAARTQFLEDMAALGDALLRVTGAARINYEILGNLDPALHAHVVPRFLDEPEAFRTKPIFAYDWEQAPTFDAVRDAALAEELRRELISKRACVS